MSALRANRFGWLLGALILGGFLPVMLIAPQYLDELLLGRGYILGVAVLSAFALPWLGAHSETLSGRAERHAPWLLAALIGGYVIVAALLANYRWRILTLGNNDSAIVIQSLYYTLEEGRPFFNTLEKVSHFGVHASFIYYLLAPLYALWRSPQGFLTLIPAASIGLSAIPFFALARARLGALAALCLTAAYLLYPPLLARATGDFYEMTLLPALLLAAFYYYERERFWPFLFFLALCLLVKESLAATVFVFALYGLVQRRGWRWTLAPAALSVGWGALAFAVLLPFFGSGTISSRAEALLGAQMASPALAWRYITGQPVAFLRSILSAPKLGLVYQLLQPLGFILPLLSAEALFALPALGLSLLAQGGSVGITAWESAIFGPVLLLSAATGIKKLTEASENRPSWLVGNAAIRSARSTYPWAVTLAAAIAFAALASASYALRAEDYAPKPYLAAQEAALALIPEASVSAPDYALARLAWRPLLQLQTGQPFWTEYHIVDTHWVESVRGRRLSERAAQEYLALVQAGESGQIYGGLRLLWSQDGIYVFKRADE
jgi:uncharacterized membrane protein